MAKVVLWTSLLIFISVASSSTVTSRPSGQCPDTWDVFGNSCYKIIAEDLTWFNAQLICKTAGSSLAVIESKLEEDFLVALALARYYGKLLWIGLNDVVQEGRFMWADTLQVPTYTNWNQNTDWDEDCVALWYEGTWQVYDCELKKPAICERHSSS